VLAKAGHSLQPARVVLEPYRPNYLIPKLKIMDFIVISGFMVGYGRNFHLTREIFAHF